MAILFSIIAMCYAIKEISNIKEVFRYFSKEQLKGYDYDIRYRKSIFNVVFCILHILADGLIICLIWKDKLLPQVQFSLEEYKEKRKTEQEQKQLKKKEKLQKQINEIDKTL